MRKLTKFFNKSENFDYLRDLIKSGEKEIVLDLDIVYDTSSYSTGIKLNVDNMVIDGAGHIIDAKSMGRIFEVTGKNITLKNIIFKNGYIREDMFFIYDRSEFKSWVFNDGGAIHNHESGTLTIINCKFKDNKARSGGAIYNGGEMNIYDSAFEANKSQAEFEGGGSIYNMKDAKLHIESSEFKKNFAKSDGGAVYNEGAMDINKSNFNLNVAEGVGGAVYNGHQNGALKINDAIFNSNTAKFDSQDGGGAIWNQGELDINRTIFKENMAKQNGASISNFEHVKIVDSEFSKNGDNEDIIFNNGSLEIYKTIFNCNNSRNVIFNSKNTKFYVFNVQFIDNNVAESVIYNEGVCSLDNSSFENNLSLKNSINICNNDNLTLNKPVINELGKTILNEGNTYIKDAPHDFEQKIEGGNIIFLSDENDSQDSKFNFDYLDRKIRESDSGEIILDEDISFSNNDIEFYEGGIDLDKDNITIDGKGKTIDGAGKSRIFIITGKNITLKNIKFKNGQTHNEHYNCFNENGGALKINSSSNLIIENCKFVDNSSINAGAALYNRGELNIVESIFNENNSINGGAILNDGDLNIYDSSFESNKADADDFSSGNGGAILNKRNGVLNINNSTFKDNFAQKNGGAIYDILGEVKIYNCDFDVNEAIWNGGAIYTKNDNKIFNIKNTFFEFNIAKNGGAICNEMNKEISILCISDCSFDVNKAKNHGGAIENNAGLTIKSTTFNANKSVYYGGAIHNASDEKLKLDNCIFNDNNSP